MKTIAQVIKAYAKMVVANGNKEDLQDDHWLLNTNGVVLEDTIREVKATQNWMNKLHKEGVDVEDEEEISNYVSDLVQDAIDKLLK